MDEAPLCDRCLTVFGLYIFKVRSSLDQWFSNSGLTVWRASTATEQLHELQEQQVSWTGKLNRWAEQVRQRWLVLAWRIWPNVRQWTVFNQWFRHILISTTGRTEVWSQASQGRTEPKLEPWKLPSLRLSWGEFIQTGMRHLDEVQHQTLEKYLSIRDVILARDTSQNETRRKSESSRRQRLVSSSASPEKLNKAAPPNHRNVKKTHEPPIRAAADVHSLCWQTEKRQEQTVKWTEECAALTRPPSCRRLHNTPLYSLTVLAWGRVDGGRRRTRQNLLSASTHRGPTLCSHKAKNKLINKSIIDEEKTPAEHPGETTATRQEKTMWLTDTSTRSVEAVLLVQQITNN